MNRLNRTTRSASVRFPSSRARVLRLLAAGMPLAVAAPALADGACMLPGGGCFVGKKSECETPPPGQHSGTYCGDNTTCDRRYEYPGAPVQIPDATISGIPGTASVQITVPDSFTVTGVHVLLHVTHQRQGDLRLTLTHMNTGHSVVLVDRPGVGLSPSGFTAQNFGVDHTTSTSALLFDASGSTPYASPPVASPGISSVTGNYRPVGSLSAVIGDNAAGVWQITATDFATGATGSIVWCAVSLDDPGPVLPVGTGAMTSQGMIPDADTHLLGLATGFGGAVSYNSTYNGSSWTGQLCGTYQGQSACLSYTGVTQSVSARTATWSVGGQLGGSAVSGSGSAVFSGSGPYSLAVHESLQIGSRTFTMDGTYTAAVDAQGRMSVNSGSETIADSAFPGNLWPGQWGRRWIWDNVNNRWVSVFRAWDPWYGWQDYAYNESTTTPMGTPGWFGMFQSVHRSCYANVDASSTAPVLNVADFTAYLQKFALNDPYANCDGSSVAPVLNVNDFTCYLQKYANGCP